jgi:transposase
MKIIRVGVDLAKNVFQLHGVDSREHVVWQKRLRRSNWLSELQQHVSECAEIGMDATR